MGIFKKIQEAQKQIVEELEADLKTGSTKIIDSIYTNQKLIAAELQDELADKLREQHSFTVDIFFDIMIKSLKRTGFLGKIAAIIVISRKDKIINNFIKKP